MTKWLREHVTVERSDWMTKPGRRAEIAIGPFTFAVDTADRPNFGFAIALRGWIGGYWLGGE
jgi:hypothetical protein